MSGNAEQGPSMVGDLRVARYRSVRQRSERLCAPLAPEDHVPQPVVDVSPPKWHLGHTTWFFETMVLVHAVPGYRVFHERYGFIFNSYYESVGERVQRVERGALSRPTVAEILAWRVHVDQAMQTLLGGAMSDELAARVELGLQHEQQHQELLLADAKYILGMNPLAPSYDPNGLGAVDLQTEHLAAHTDQPVWHRWNGGPCDIGHAGEGFAFDNESARHTVHIAPMALRDSLVSNAEYLAFMADGGYQRFELWHSEGWAWLQGLAHRAPLYWQPDPEHPGGWMHYTLQGLMPLAPQAPVSHLSYFEAHAFCQWAGWRLPTEFEWEALADRFDWGQRWEWTESAYLPYPGFSKATGALGEYNGKFMVSQMVLRGASFATPPSHARRSYRNFFHPPLRWQYTGLRPARA